MSPAVIIGGIILIFGLIMSGDPKSFGFKSAAMGVATAAAGGFLMLFGFYGQTGNGAGQGGGGRRVRDHSV